MKKFLRIYLQIINETRVNYRLTLQNKLTLKVFFLKILKGLEINLNGLADYLYNNIIRGGIQNSNELTKAKCSWFYTSQENMTKIELYYLKVVNLFSNCGNNHWKQFLVGHKNNRENSYNIYFTIDLKTFLNFKNFCKGLFDLKRRCILFSRSNNDLYISFKTHALILDLIDDNDTLKIYYKDQNLKLKILNMLNDWLVVNKLLKYERAYLNGVDLNKLSFGQIKSRKIVKKLILWLKVNGSVYTVLQYLQSFLKYLFEWLRDI